MFEDGRVVQSGLRTLVLRPDERQGLVGQIGLVVDYGNEVAVSHHLRARKFLRRARVHALQLCAVCRRPQHSRVHHSGQLEVSGVLGLPGHFFRAILALGRVSDHLERRHRFQRHLAQVTLDALAFDQLGIRNPLALRRIRDDALAHLQPFDGSVPFLRRHLQQHRPGFGRGPAQNRPEDSHGLRAERAHIPRAHVRVHHHHVDRVVDHVQFFGHQLRQRRLRPLAHLDPPDVARHPAIRPDVEEGIEVGRG